VQHAKGHLPEIARALGTPGGGAGRLHGGQQQADERADDRYYHEQLDEREAAADGERTDTSAAALVRSGSWLSVDVHAGLSGVERRQSRSNRGGVATSSRETLGNAGGKGRTADTLGSSGLPRERGRPVTAQSHHTPQLRQKAFRGSGCRHERFSEEQKQDRFSRKSVAGEAARLSTTRPRSATPMHKDSDRVRPVKRLSKKIL
jgi:hypothetical protein